MAKIKGNSECRLVFLDTPFDVCFERISGDTGSRPLVKLGRDRLYELYEERLPFYQLAELKLDMAQIAEINRPEQLLES